MIASDITVSTGGTVTGGLIAETLQVVTASATAHSSSVGANIGTKRSLPAGDYYLKLTSLDATSSGIFALEWEQTQ